MVDRQILFDNLRRVRAWIPIDGTFPWDAVLGTMKMSAAGPMIFHAA